MEVRRGKSASNYKPQGSCVENTLGGVADAVIRARLTRFTVDRSRKPIGPSHRLLDTSSRTTRTVHMHT